MKCSNCKYCKWWGDKNEQPYQVCERPGQKAELIWDSDEEFPCESGLDITTPICIDLNKIGVLKK